MRTQGSFIKKLSVGLIALIITSTIGLKLASAAASVEAVTPCIVTIFGQQYDVSPLQTSHSGGNIFTCGTDMTAVYQPMHGTDVSRIAAYLIPSITVIPTTIPTAIPTTVPTVTPTVTPTVDPTVTPTVTPGVTPSVTPSISPAPRHEKEMEENDDVHEHQENHHGESEHKRKNIISRNGNIHTPDRTKERNED